jgi:Homeodomain-like domain
MLNGRLGPEHDQRFSFCCAVDGCRSRETPPSLRFLGRKVYLAAIVVLIAIMRHGLTGDRMRQINEVVGVDRRTVERWRAWWRDGFTATQFWQVARATFMPPVDQDRLPAALLERFGGDDADRLVALLRFIGPLTGGRARAS